MDMNIGNIIANLRKQRGLTQEQIAIAVGVSTPAVSKWETDSSYPDITLLAPIARVLGTNVDTLLSFTPKLTDEQSAAFAGEVVSISLEKGGQEALKRMQEVLCTYPENPALQCHMASILTGLPMKSETEKEANKQHAKKLFEAVIKSGDAKLFASAAYMLANLCLADNELDRAEELLESMPGPSPDVQLMKASLYERRGDMKKAKLTVQTSLFIAFQKAETFLSTLMSKKYTPETETALHICEIHKQIAILIDYPYAMSDGLFADAYMREGNMELAADSILNLAKSLSGEAKAWGHKLFSEMNMDTAQMNVTLRHMRKMVCDSLLKDEMYEQLQENAKYKEAVKLLQS